MAILLLENDRVSASSKENLPYTPLIFATYRGHIEIVNLLLSHSSEVNHENSLHYTALSAAITNGYTSIARLLLEYPKTEVDQKNAEGITPLGFAAIYGRTEIVERLLPHANINSKDNLARTPLLFAALNGYTSTVRCLLE